MNTSGNGRWGRYRKDPKTGEKQKKCTGTLHPEEGAWLPLSAYFILKKGKRAGKPISQCKECQRYQKFGTKNRGFIYYAQIMWIFHELERRIGRAETCRRVGVSQNFWMRAERGQNTKIRRSTVAKAMAVLLEARSKDEVRHRLSIRHGAAARGRVERKVVGWSDYYKPHGDQDTDDSRRRRKRTRMMDTYLCGCSVGSKRGYTVDVREIVVAGRVLEAQTDKRYDSQGYEVCPEHGQRLYGWLTNTERGI